MTQALDLFRYDITDETVSEMRVGQIGTVKGKLEAVRFGGGAGRSHNNSARAGPTNANPSLVVAFADWTMFAITLRDYATAKGIRIPLGAYVGVKVQKIHEGGDLMALAIWELGGKGAVMPLGEPMRERNNLGVWTS